MNKSDGLAYLNRFIKEGKDFVYSGPAFLYKYRSFDQFTYEMLKEKYLYLCPADKLDDETECISSIDTNNIVDLENNNLKRTGLEQIIRMIRPYCSEENYEHVRYMIYRTSTGDGRVRNSFLLDLMPELQQLVPNVDLTPFLTL